MIIKKREFLIGIKDLCIDSNKKTKKVETVDDNNNDDVFPSVLQADISEEASIKLFATINTIICNNVYKVNNIIIINMINNL